MQKKYTATPEPTNHVEQPAVHHSLTTVHVHRPLADALDKQNPIKPDNPREHNHQDVEWLDEKENPNE